MSEGRRRVRFRRDNTNPLGIEPGEGVDDYSFRLGVVYAGHILRHITRSDLDDLDIQIQMIAMKDCCRAHLEWMGQGVASSLESLAGWGMTCSECEKEPDNGARSS